MKPRRPTSFGFGALFVFRFPHFSIVFIISPSKPSPRDLVNILSNRRYSEEIYDSMKFLHLIIYYAVLCDHMDLNVLKRLMHMLRTKYRLP